MTEFQVGDRVVVYDTMCPKGESYAKVVSRTPKPPFIAVCFEQPIDDARDYYVHPMQCRKAE